MLCILLSYFLFLISYSLFLPSCSTLKQISRSANVLLNDSALVSGHVGINFFEPATNKIWFSHNSEKYFIPASNTKLFTLYAGLKYLPDSLPGINYYEFNDTTFIEPTGDPTFLHPDFTKQTVLNFLRSRKNIEINLPGFTDYVGKGWAWDDYKEGYMAQRSALPMYGNVLTLKKINNDSISIYPAFFSKYKTFVTSMQTGFSIEKSWDNNSFSLGNGTRQRADVPFRPNDSTIIGMLSDVLAKRIERTKAQINKKDFKVLYSEPADSLFKIMMHRSDNFFAEQILLMASNEKLGEMDDGKMINYLLQNEFKDLPQKPKWVDGSGLSRYNLFTPENFVYILNEMEKEFGMERMKSILPAGGKGTLENYYKSDSSFIYAKTGTLSNNLALSGYIFTRKNKFFIFSILVNNFPSGATPVRKAIEKFLQGIIRKY